MDLYKVMIFTQVCDYHKMFYRPENLYVIITGMVEPEQVFDAIHSFEEKILSKVWLPGPLLVTLGMFKINKKSYTVMIFDYTCNHHGKMASTL